MHYVPVTVASGIDGPLTKKALREALHRNPAGVTFRVESEFHGSGDQITGHHAVNRDWYLEVHDDQGRSKAMVVFKNDGEPPHHLQAVVR